MSILTDKLAEDVVAAVKEAGALLTRARRRPGDTRQEAHGLRDERGFRRAGSFCARGFPPLAGEAQFMGEEQDNSGIDPARPVWILDPVDGTTNLIRNLRHSAVSLALAEGGRVVFGAVYNPYAPELFTRAARRRGVPEREADFGQRRGPAGAKPRQRGHGPGPQGVVGQSLRRDVRALRPRGGRAPLRLREPRPLRHGLRPA